MTVGFFKWLIIWAIYELFMGIFFDTDEKKKKKKKKKKEQENKEEYLEQEEPNKRKYI